MATASAASTLTPSQAIRSVSGGGAASASAESHNNSTDPGGTGEAKRNRGRQRRRNKSNKSTNQGNDAAVGQNQGPAEDVQGAENQPSKTNSKNNNKQNGGAAKKRNPRKKKEKSSNDSSQGPNVAPQGGGKEESSKNIGTKKPNVNVDNTNQKRNNSRKNNRNRKRYPWRKHIPAGTVDPITLESLASLPYPPFGLCAAAPYVLVEWPPKDPSQQNNSQKKDVDDPKERERRLLQEQWGHAVLPNEEDSKPPAEAIGPESVDPKHINLFDGRALAYYMVSQLQFIDPLNRRDLTRDELCHLDRYLVRNNFTDLNVVEAYDTKGVSLSTAGAASTTAAGRMEILQQEARVLLNALFGGGQNALPAASSNGNNSNNNNRSNSLMQQYSNYQAAEEQQQQRQQGRQAGQQNYNSDYFAPDEGGDAGIYGGDDHGIMVIDDDLNPSMRGSSQGFRPYQPAPPPSSHDATLWSANRSNSAALRPQNFPALSTAATLPVGQSPLNSSAPAYVPPGGSAPAPAAAPSRAPDKKKALPPVKSLKFITKAVKKTTPEETQRQFEAREEARRKAMLSNLTFGSNPASWAAADAPQPPSSLPQPTNGQVARNRAFADALGLPAPSAKTAATNWSRPIGAGDNVVLYPDALILTAREKMGLLLKLERKWIAFLQDDRAASLPLNNMDRDSRAFTHEYSDFWKLHTESFDPEPKRYIHCVKLMDTSAPYPLLSDAARNWRGPTGLTTPSMLEHALQQTAGQDTRGRSPVGIDLVGDGLGPLPTNPRATALTTERTKLELKERTLPLELPPFQPPEAAAAIEIESEDQKLRRKARLEEQKRKEREREERKQKVLEAAFASDDEEESLGEVDADSDWEEGEALYAASDEEE